MQARRLQDRRRPQQDDGTPTYLQHCRTQRLAVAEPGRVLRRPQAVSVAGRREPAATGRVALRREAARKALTLGRGTG